jgi:hypothetical protein
VIVQGSEAVAQAVELRIALPDGLHWASDGPDSTPGCSGASSVVCTGTIDPTGDSPSAYWSWRVVAERPGAYEITASVSSRESDPSLANNSVVFRFQVLGSSGGSAAVTATRVKLTPLAPKAGSAVAATVLVTAGGTPVRPTRVVCAGSLGGARLTGSPQAHAGSATCVYHPPKSARAKTLRGSVSFTAHSTRLTRRFSTRLG